ncbi:hypothetical protein [Dragonfly-associated microphage 1]|uniref:hypothetical protein n=1 Tax=Dragonfly-associated microphage 1 TaxID=1234888 RepID=UPI00028BABEF|nr:hypothetical protein [Dragonfly-associated microphage 1]AFS65320.1 hypothetical protein [Dragonfly-associated microphage 1]
MKFDEKGRELPDPTPIEIPTGFRRPETLQEQIRRLIRSEQFAAQMGRPDAESFEEANDFDVDDDGELPVTQHEFTAMALEKPNDEYDDADDNPRRREVAAGPAGDRAPSRDDSDHGSDADPDDEAGSVRRDPGQRGPAGSRSVGDVKESRQPAQGDSGRRSKGASGT